MPLPCHKRDLSWDSPSIERKRRSPVSMQMWQDKDLYLLKAFGYILEPLIVSI